MEPSYRRTRNEALWAAAAWLLAGIWVIVACYWMSYGRLVHSVGGVPNWVLWGIFLPWLILFLHNCWFSLVYMKDDDAESPSDGPREPAE